MLNLKEISAVIIQTNYTLSIAKGELEKYLSNTSIDLEERWLVFCTAPTAIKNREDYVHTFKWENEHGVIDWYDDFYIAKHETVYMDELVDFMVENDFTQEQLIDMKEEVLECNLHSFEMDW